MNDLSETARIMEAKAPASAVAALAGADAAVSDAGGAARRTWSTSVSSIKGPLARWWGRQPLIRFIRASLGRRILMSNIMGLLGLLLGMLYLSLSHAWLLDAKIEVVRTLSRITAEAIAYRAVNETRKIAGDLFISRARQHHPRQRFVRRGSGGLNQLLPAVNPARNFSQGSGRRFVTFGKKRGANPQLNSVPK